jgi:tetratricopeptide (TPR) repeat protein
LDPGQTWFSPWTEPQLSFTVLDLGPVKVAAGEFRHTLKIGYRPLSSPIYQGYIWFKPGVGLLAQEESGYRTELVSYTLSDLLAPATVTVSGDKLFALFRSAARESNVTEPVGFWSRFKNMTLSGPYYLFLFLFLIGILSLFGYLNAKKVEMDLENNLEVQEGETALASAMVREGLYEDASRILQRLSARHPQWPDVAALLGRAYRETGKLSEACLELKRALTLNPHLVRARLELVKTYLLMSEPARALEEVETVLTEHQSFADAIYLKGEVLASMGLDQEALKCFRESLEINPSFTEAQNALERILAEED